MRKREAGIKYKKKKFKQISRKSYKNVYNYSIKLWQRKRVCERGREKCIAVSMFYSV